MQINNQNCIKNNLKALCLTVIVLFLSAMIGCRVAAAAKFQTATATSTNFNSDTLQHKRPNPGEITFHHSKFVLILPELTT